MSDYNKRLGAYGEKLASEFFLRRGYCLAARNYRTRFGEIDLIVCKGDELLFIEVKTRTASGNGYPEMAVGKSKAEHLRRAALAYLSGHGFQLWRLDILSVEIDRRAKTAKLKWFKDIQAG